MSLLVYLGAAWWLAHVAPAERLVSDNLLMIDFAAWPPAVVAGLLGATFSSALASIVGAPRILQALGEGEGAAEARVVRSAHCRGRASQRPDRDRRHRARRHHAA